MRLVVRFSKRSAPDRVIQYAGVRSESTSRILSPEACLADKLGQHRYLIGYCTMLRGDPSPWTFDKAARKSASHKSWRCVQP